MSQSRKKRNISVTIQVDGEDHRLEGIPKDAWESFKIESKRHFPDSGDEAWASYLSEVIVATLSSYSYFLTNVPEDHARSMDNLLKQVGWNWEQFHVYLLKSAVEKDHFRLISFHNKDENEEQRFGTFIATGLDVKGFKNIEESTKYSFEVIMATILKGCMEGTIKFDPTTTFIESMK